MRGLSGGRLLVGGNFTAAGNSSAASIALWNGASWSPVGTGVWGTVRALAQAPNGDWFAAGSIGPFGPTSSSLYRAQGGDWSPIPGALNGGATALAVLPNGDVLVGGFFTTANGLSTPGGVARWDGLSWSALGSGISLPGAAVNSFWIAKNGDVLAAGRYVFSTNVYKGFIARYSAPNWTILLDDLSGAGSAPPGFLVGAVQAVIGLPGGGIIAGGTFNSAAGAPASNIVQWTGTTWTTMSSGVNGPVTTLFSHPALGVVAGGSFTTAGGASARSIAAWNGAAWSPVGAGLPGGVTSIATFENGDLAAGSGVGSSAGSGDSIMRWNGQTWATVGVGTNGLIDRVYALPGGDLLAAGTFDRIEGVAASRIARRSGSTWHPLGSGVNGAVRAMAAASSGVIYAGGLFTSAGGNSANLIAKWDGTNWTPLGSGVAGGNSPSVEALQVLPNGDVVAGGSFTHAGGVQVNNIARWNGAAWFPLNQGTSGSASGAVAALALLPNGDLVAGGSFNQPASRIARWDGSAWWPLGIGFDEPSSAAVTTIARLSDGSLAVGGYFNMAGGIPTIRIARWNGNAWSAMGQLSQAPYDLKQLPSGEVVVCGWMNPPTDSWILRWNNSTWIPLSPHMNGRVHSLAVTPDGTLTAAGEFSGAGSVVAAHLASLTCLCYPNCDNSTVIPLLTANDFQCFINKYANNDPYANCDGSTATPALTANDFQCFINKYAAGCP